MYFTFILFNKIVDKSHQLFKITASSKLCLVGISLFGFFVFILAGFFMLGYISTRHLLEHIV